MNATLAPLDPELVQTADADATRRDLMTRMAAATLRPAPLTLDEARLVRDQKIAQVLDNVESISDQWGRVAYLFLVGYARRHHRFIGQDVVRASRFEIDPPHTDRCWGPIFKRALVVGCIRRIGYAQAPHRHASPCPEYESMIWREVP